MRFESAFGEALKIRVAELKRRVDCGLDSAKEKQRDQL
jgi:hypothetical protein